MPPNEKLNDDKCLSSPNFLELSSAVHHHIFHKVKLPILCSSRQDRWTWQKRWTKSFCVSFFYASVSCRLWSQFQSSVSAQHSSAISRMQACAYPVRPLLLKQSHASARCTLA